ncbi:helix-turn-helix domain-containing protein [Halobacterium yunchengense]|uniref:helix-turn-helix domain-containing protein n=1 Tax=Halobacterium yunchengense TaxID=3108497 RepID=UPI00300901FE
MWYAVGRPGPAADPQMATFTEVRFGHEDGALADTLAALPDVDVRVLPDTRTDPERVVYAFAFEGAPDGRLRDALEADHTVRDAREIEGFGGHDFWGIEFASETELLGPAVVAAGGFVVDARSASADHQPRGWVERWSTPDTAAVHDVWEHARDEGFAFEILDVLRQTDAATQYPVGDALTDEQKRALRAAYECGYFTDPREASLESVAETLDQSPSAVSGCLRRGMRSLIGTTLAVDEPEP